MIAYLAVVMTLFSSAEPIVIESRLYGSPSMVESLLRVTCAERTYKVLFDNSLNERSIVFDRGPVAPTEEMSSKVLSVLDKFLGVPFIESSCSGPNEAHPAGMLMLKVEGRLKMSDRAARVDCLGREGMFDGKSLWILNIDGDVVEILRDDIGQCTTKEDIDEFHRLYLGKSK